jgi:hypothetical protein
MNNKNLQSSSNKNLLQSNHPKTFFNQIQRPSSTKQPRNLQIKRPLSLSLSLSLSRARTVPFFFDQTTQQQYHRSKISQIKTEKQIKIKQRERGLKLKITEPKVQTRRRRH